MKWFKELSSVVALAVLFTFSFGNLQAAKKAPKCTERQIKALKKGHKKVRIALGHLNITKNIFGKSYTDTVSHVKKAHGFLNTMRGKEKKQKRQHEYKNSYNMCEAQKNLKKAKENLVIQNIGACWKVSPNDVQVQLAAALTNINSAITSKSVDCSEKDES